MQKQNQRKLQWLSLIPMVAQSVLAVGGARATAFDPADITVRDAPIGVGQQIMEASALGIEMVDNSIAVLEQGLEGMSEVERAHFLRFFDPGTTGEADDRFLQDVLGNFRRIRVRMVEQMVVEYESSSIVCTGDMQLYYTDFSRVHICPYFLVEGNDLRLARDYVHEVGHMALLVLDRAYFYPNFTPYQELTPRGHWTASIPVIGPIFREIARGDTLYHPDAYSKLAESLLCLQLQSTGGLPDNLKCAPHISAVAVELARADAPKITEAQNTTIDPSDLKFLSVEATPEG